MSYDAIILGGGLMGASAAAALAKDGKKVLVLDAREAHHTQGSSHGQTRITRRFNFEHPVFNETAADTLSAMRAMERAPGDMVQDMPAIFTVNKDSESYRVLKENLDKMGAQTQELSSEQVAQMGLAIAPGRVGIVDKNAALFNPEKILDRLYADIKQQGGEIRFATPASRWESSAEGVTVHTQQGETIKAKQVVLATGAWMPQTLAQGNATPRIAQSLGNAMKLERVPLFYFEYPPNLPDIIPLDMLDDNRCDIYAMPERDAQGNKWLKVGFHHGQIVDSPEAMDRTVNEEEKAQAARAVEALTGHKPTLHKTTMCIYARATDGELPLVGALPSTPHVYMASYSGGACAKHALALGTLLGEIMQEKPLSYDATLFSPARITAAQRLQQAPQAIER